MNTWIISIAACAVGFSAFFSCTYGVTDEDWTKNGRVRLTLDWQGTPHPARMDYYFYREGAAHPVIRRADAQGFEGTLPSGTYKVAVCNSDPHNIQLETGNGYEKANGMVKQASVLEPPSLSLTGPDNLFGCGGEPLAVGGEKIATQTLYPVGLVRTLELHIRITESGKEEIALSGLSGRLTGVSPGVHIPSGAALSGAPALMAFETERTGEAKYRALLTLFGLTDSGAPGLYLILKGEGGKELTAWVGIPPEVGDMFRRKTSARVILDLVVAYDEVNGLSGSLEDWKEGTGHTGPNEGEIG